MSWVALAGMATLLGALAVVGCGGPQTACQTDTECGPAARCDTEAKVCFQRTEDTNCTPACADWQFCSQGTCFDRYEAIAVLQPDAGAVVNGSAVVRAQLRPVASWISLRQHASLAYVVNQGAATVNSGNLVPVGDAGIYQGPISVVTAGQYTLKAGFPGFPAGAPVSADVGITVDVTAPTFSVDAGTRSLSSSNPDERDPLLANAFKRNDVVTVSFESADTDLDLSSVALTVQGVDAGTQTTFAVSGGGTCGASRCWTATVDLATVEMWALRGRMTITASGQDVAGNLGQRSIQIPVTRFKWSRAMPSSAAISASPAVGAQGTIYVATNAGGASTLSAIRPDGREQWATPANLGSAFLASPAVGKGDGGGEVVYAIPNGNPPVLYALHGADGGQAVSPITAPTSGSPEASPLIAATSVFSDVRESSTTYLNATGASLGTLRFGSGTGLFGVGSGGSVGFPGNVVGEDNEAFAADDSLRVRQYSSNASGWSESATVRTTIDAPKGLLLSPTFVAAATATTVIAFPRTTGSIFSRSASNPSIPILVGGDLVYSESNGTVTRVTPGSNPATPGSVGGATTSPLLANGAIYFVRTTNSLHVLDLVLGPLWADVVEGSVTIASSPNIDCARSSTGAKLPGPGTLYYGANNGKLYAIIVDNPGIDTTSPWPKYQHDPRNTGSLSTPLSEFTCP